MARRMQDWPSDPVLFLLDRDLRLTSVKVVDLRDIKAGRKPVPLWELVSDSNSIPVRSFVYGFHIRGMRPATKRAAAQPLQPGTTYRLLITAGRDKAEHDFTPSPPKS